MLRALVVLLLLANALFFAWTQGWLAPLLPPRAETREPERLKAQSRPELVTVLTQKAASAAVAAASAAASEPASETEKLVCLEAGPFNEAAVKQAETVLTEAGVPEAAVNHELSSQASTWGVVMGRFPDRDTLRQKAEELRRLNVRFDELTTPPMLVPGLRLGNFSDRYGAEAALRDLNQKGVRTARVVELPAGAVQHWLRAPRADAELQTRLKSLPVDKLGKGFVPCAAPDAAKKASG